jgi:carboxylate-amine ligase
VTTSRSQVGATIGVEEEYHLVDPSTGATVNCPDVVNAAADGRFGPRVQAELRTAQMETATGVCTTLAELRAELITARTEAAAAASCAGAALLASGSHPFTCWHEGHITEKPRYQALQQRFGLLTRQQIICGCHVHVSVPNLDVAVAVMTRARPWLPVLLALTCSSPFQDGVDSGYASWRVQAWERWPHSGPPPHLETAEDYLHLVDELTATGIIDDASSLYWDIRPSLRYPTLEFRIADACPDLDDAVTHAALARSLARTVAGQAERGLPAPDIRDEVLRAARWRAARYGLTDRLVDPVLGTLVPASAAVRRLLRTLEPDLVAHGEWDVVATRVSLLLARGTSAARQRAVYAATGDLAAVVRDTVAQTENPIRTVTVAARAG